MRERETVSRIDESKIRVPDYYEETCELLRRFVDSCPKCSVDEYNEFRDTFLSWLPDYRIGYLIEERKIQSQTILDLFAELYHKLKSKRPRQTPQQALTAVDVYEHYLDVYRHSRAAYDAVTPLLEQGNHGQAVP